MEKALDGGIKIISSSYISVGQNTLYLQKFDVDNSDGTLYWHQYMQNILAAQNEGTTLRKTFESINAIDNEYTFIIPVFENMPKSISVKPNITINLENIEGADLVKANVTDCIKIRNEPNGAIIKGYLYSGEIANRLEKATFKVNGTYWDKILKSNGTIGYVARCTYDSESVYKEYLISIGKSTESSNSNKSLNDNNSTNNTNSANTLNNTTNSNTTNNTIDNEKEVTQNTNNNTNTTIFQKETEQKNDIIKGDVNGDGKITSSDYVLIKNHIMGTKIIDKEFQKFADYNGDGKITSSDYVLIKNYIMSI